MSSRDLEAKIVILGAANVGKTSLLHRFLHASFLPPSQAIPTVGASFSTKRLVDPDDPHSIIRLQLWDTAGQERFRSISKLYYRNADAAILTYDITSEASFREMGTWLQELRSQTRADDKEIIIHVVGTKADVVREDPGKRAVPFEECMRYVSEHLHAPRPVPKMLAQAQGYAQAHGQAHISPPFASRPRLLPNSPPLLHSRVNPHTHDNRSSSPSLAPPTPLDLWDSCHEISAKDNEGVDEVFRVLTRKLLDQRARREANDADFAGRTPGVASEAGDYFEGMGNGRGSFRLTANDGKRRSWMGMYGGSYPGTPGGWQDESQGEGARGGRCC